MLIIEAKQESYYINGNSCNQMDALLRLANLDHHIVSQFEHQHQYANEVFASTTNTIRFVTMRDYEAHKAFIGACFHRVGTFRPILVDNIGQGGLLCAIDMESGIIGSALAWRTYTGVRFLGRHPDTGFLFSEKVIPGWDYVRSKLLRMADRLAFLPYMG